MAEFCFIHSDVNDFLQNPTNLHYIYMDVNFVVIVKNLSIQDRKAGSLITKIHEKSFMGTNKRSFTGGM